MRKQMLMQLIIRRLRFFFKLTVALTIIAFTTSACAVHEFPSFSLKVNECTSYRDQNSIAIGVDPFVEKDRLEKHFGVDLLNEYTDGIPARGIPPNTILPVYVVTENKSNNKALLDINEIKLSTRDGKVVVKAVDGVTAGLPVRFGILERASKMNNMFLYGSLILTPVGAVIVLLLTAPFTMKIPNARDESIDLNLRSKSLLPEKNIASGEINSGFAFFLIDEKDLEYLSTSSVLQVSIKDPDINGKTNFDFDMNLKDLNKRVVKHNYKNDSKTMP